MPFLFVVMVPQRLEHPQTQAQAARPMRLKLRTEQNQCRQIPSRLAAIDNDFGLRLRAYARAIRDALLLRCFIAETPRGSGSSRSSSSHSLGSRHSTRCCCFTGWSPSTGRRRRCTPNSSSNTCREKSGNPHGRFYHRAPETARSFEARNPLPPRALKTLLWDETNLRNVTLTLFRTLSRYLLHLRLQAAALDNPQVTASADCDLNEACSGFQSQSKGLRPFLHVGSSDWSRASSKKRSLKHPGTEQKAIQEARRQRRLAWKLACGRSVIALTLQQKWGVMFSGSYSCH